MIKRRRTCRVCNGSWLIKIWDFGMTPLANAYVEGKDLDKPELYFPLEVNQCKHCLNIQLAHVVDPRVLFNEYLYSSSTSPVFVKHFEDFAAKMGKKDFVVDIGSNDGILLKPFQKIGSKVLGIEPARTIDSSVPTVRDFWNIELAKKIRNKEGQADLITATNVFAHIDNLDDVLQGVQELLRPDGMFMVEVADVEEMFKVGSFDLIYHEHLNYWSESTFRRFFELRGMDVLEVEHTPVHGGSLRVYAGFSKQN